VINHAHGGPLNGKLGRTQLETSVSVTFHAKRIGGKSKSVAKEEEKQKEKERKMTK